MSKFKELRKNKGLTQEELRSQFNAKYNRSYTAAAISLFENNKRIPETSALKDFADFFNVSIDYLLGNDAPSAPAALSVREERQIESDLEDMLNSMSNAGYNSNNNDFEDIEAFKATIKSAMLQAKKIAKKKYTPKKYQKD